MAFEFKFPDIGEGVVEGEIVSWLVKEGDEIDEDQPLVEVMTDKATVEIPSPRAGRVARLCGAEGEIVEVGATLVVIDDGDGAPQEPPQEVKPVPAPPAAKAPDRAAGGRTLATPAVRRLAREKGVDLARLEGTGPGGRVTAEDVERFAAGPAAVPVAVSGDVESIPYRGVRKKIGEKLSLSKRTAPHFTYVEEVDMTELIRLRSSLLESQKEDSIRITYLPFLMKAIVEGLKKYPLLNATLDEDQGLIRLKKYYNLGIATATDQGLIVPVVKAVDSKDVFQLSREVERLSEQARQGRIALEDLRDGTFTITSLGALGGVMATPIINYPEVAILGVHKIEEKPVVRDGQIVVRSVMNLSISLDHRVVDGHVGAEFLHFVIPLLENPEPPGQ